MRSPAARSRVGTIVDLFKGANSKAEEKYFKLRESVS
jgi:hypothetical protein